MSKTRAIPLRFFGRIGLLVVLTWMAGCSHPPFTSTARRDAAFAPFRDAKVGDIPIQDFLARRTAIVLVGSEITDTKQSTEAARQSLEFSYSSKFRLGSAVMIDARGYLLTAAHVVGATPITVIYYDGGVLCHQQARIIWNGSHEPGKPDLTLVRVAQPLTATYQWAEHYEANDSVLAVGVNYTDPQKPNFTMGFTGGKLGRDRPFQRTQTTQTVTSDLPLHVGDSGGPLVNTQGQLIAINVRGTMSRLEYLGIARKLTSEAIRPDIAWLKQLIEEDFAKDTVGTRTSAL